VVYPPKDVPIPVPGTNQARCKSNFIDTPNAVTAMLNHHLIIIVIEYGDSVGNSKDVRQTSV